jgi:hypothetical protein
LPANRNPNVIDLLSWHGHDRGGVRVPFGRFGEPLGRIIETPILDRLRVTAGDLAAGQPAPRWIFLVGGPGNGKSQMVEEFVRALGAGLGREAQLVDAVASKFNQSPVPRKVEIDRRSGGEGLGPDFESRVSRLVLIQDASASDRSDRDAAEQLHEDILNLLTEPRPRGEPIPVMVCCVNRGMLARTLMAIDAGPPVIDLLESLAMATGLGEESLLRERPSCWPIEATVFGAAFPEMQGLVACWPMDIESLLSGYAAGESPGEAIIAQAVSPARWEDAGCSDCDYRQPCPLYQNARWLRGEREGHALRTLLRRQELATGQRWNFRSLFSLLAELLVGERDDFTLDGGGQEDPCVWVHQTSRLMLRTEPDEAVAPALRLMNRLYPHALFVGALPTPRGEIREITQPLPVAGAITDFLMTRPNETGTSIRRRLESSVLPVLDPATWSPSLETDQLYELEDAYSQAISLGNDFWPADTPKAAAEDRVLACLVAAEEECDQLSPHQPAKALAGETFLRRVAATIAKRSVGVRLGRHANEELLAEYASTIRDQERLAELQIRLRDLITGQQFRANALGAFGQPESSESNLVVLVSNPVRLFPIRPAPDPQPQLPAHDLPAIPVADGSIPLTFDLFAALKLRDRGCSPGSMPASVRAALDRMKQLYAGSVCRNEEDFLAGGTYFEINKKGRVVVASEGGMPRLTRSNAS